MSMQNSIDLTEDIEADTLKRLYSDLYCFNAKGTLSSEVENVLIFAAHVRDRGL